MKIFEKPGWFRIDLPDHWVVDEEEDPIAIYDPDGAGALHITVQQPGPLKPEEAIDPFAFLQAFLRQTGVGFVKKNAEQFEQGKASGARYHFQSSGPEGALRERLWFLTKGDLLLFATYTCREEEERKEREAVDRVMGSVQLKAI